MVEANIFELDGIYVPEPPIFIQINACLSQAKSQNVAAAKMYALFEHFRESYKIFLINLNKHIFHYGESGFRLSDEARDDMESLYQKNTPP